MPNLYNGKMKAFNKWCWTNWMSTCRGMKRDPYVSLNMKLKSKWIKDLNIKLDTLNLIEEKEGNSREYLGTRDKFLKRTPVA